MANSLAMVFEYLGGAVGLTVSGTIHRSTLASRFEHISKDLIVSFLFLSFPLPRGSCLQCCSS